MPSVVIPAHDEAGSIARLLRLLEPLAHDTKIVVVCNGCTDDTAAKARRAAPWAKIIELCEASKPAALDAGDAVAASFPRAYIDADVDIDAQAIRTMFDALRDGIHAVAACPAEDLSASSMMVRAYYAIWCHMTTHIGGIDGTGAMAVTAEGRARFASWPRIIGDDYFLDGQFRPWEKRRIPEVTVTQRAPRGLRDCVSRKARMRQGNLDVISGGLRDAHKRGGLRGALAVIKDRPSLAACLPAHVLVTMAARSLTRWRRWRGTAQVWHRDHSRVLPPMIDAPPDLIVTTPEVTATVIRGGPLA